MKEFKTYIYKSGSYDLTYSSNYRKGSKNNFNDLYNAQYKRYGRYGIIESFNDYKKELNKIYIYE